VVLSFILKAKKPDLAPEAGAEQAPV